MTFSEVQQFCFGSYRDHAASIGQHLAAAAALRAIRQDEFPFYLRAARAAFVSSYTIQGLADVCAVRALFHNIRLETYAAPYNQFSQELFGTDSGFARFKPHVAYGLLDEPDIINDAHLQDLIRGLRRVAGHAVMFRFVSERSGRADRVAAFNAILEQSVAADPAFHVFDFARFLEEIGTKEHWYTKYKQMGDFRLAPAAFMPLAESLMPLIIAANGVTKKCLVVDLDNTLWRGIIGEDGMDGITPDTELQERIRQLYEQGVILAINSRNNPSDALEAIERHPAMALRADHFAAMRINWHDKAANVRELAEELNIGLESMVFMDDEEFQRERVRQSFPQIAVIHPHQLGAYAGFSAFTLTEEDRARGAMYAQERKRKELSSQLPTVDEFLRELKLEVVIEPADEATMPRIAQLTQKTNQFNLTTRRYLTEDIAECVRRGWHVWTARARDRFGDYGLIGVAMAQPQGDEWRIDNFLFSCRVLGRGIEHVLLAFILERAKQSGKAAVHAEFIPTTKNKPCERFYEENGFSLHDQATHLYTYRLALDTYAAAYPSSITLHLPS